MSDKKYNFNLGNRSLTADETQAVEIAKGVFRESLERHGHGKIIEGSVVFTATSTGSAKPSVNRERGTDVVNKVTAEPRKTAAGGRATPDKPLGTDVINKPPPGWSTNKVVAASRKY